MVKKIPDQCKTCRHLSTRGIQNDIYNKWCCKFGDATWRKINHCIVQNGYDSKE